MWKTIKETFELISKFPQLDRLQSFFALSRFFSRAIYPEGYQANERWPSILIPTEAGKKYLEDLTDIMSSFRKVDFMLALFGIFFHHEIMFDWELSDIDGIRSILEKELLSGRIKLPYRFGRILYDKFNDQCHKDRTDHIPACDVAKLLNDTPVGIYQLGKFISGPLGILKSQETRFVPPSLDLPLWHCSDTGCRMPHKVALLPPRIPLVEAYAKIEDYFFAKYGPSSEWLQPLLNLFRGGNRGGKKYADLPIFICDSIIGSERINLAKLALESKFGKILREILSSPPRKKSRGQGSAEDVASKLTLEEQAQILLVISDQELVQLIDSLIQKNLNAYCLSSENVMVVELRQA